MIKILLKIISQKSLLFEASYLSFYLKNHLLNHSYAEVIRIFFRQLPRIYRFAGFPPKMTKLTKENTKDKHTIL